MCHGEMWADTNEMEAFKYSHSEGFISLEEVVSLAFVEDTSVPTPFLVILSFSYLPEGFNS